MIEHAAQVCDTCITTKIRRRPFPQKAAYSAEQPLELVHGDLCGPITPATPEGRCYFLLMVDATRFMFVVLLATKDKAAQAVKKIKAQAEETGHELKVLWTDNGGEFTCSELTEHFAMEIVKRHFSAPHSPQKNGVVERRNQTVVATAQALLKQRGMPARFCGEAVVTAAHLLNRSPKSLQGMTPYEAWHGRAPSVVRLWLRRLYTRDLGQLHNLDVRGVPGIFIGYAEGAKAYRVYDPASGRVRPPAMSSSTKGAGGIGQRRWPDLLQRHRATSTSSGPLKQRRHLRPLYQHHLHRVHPVCCLLLQGSTIEATRTSRRLLPLA